RKAGHRQRILPPRRQHFEGKSLWPVQRAVGAAGAYREGVVASGKSVIAARSRRQPAGFDTDRPIQSGFIAGAMLAIETEQAVLDGDGVEAGGNRSAIEDCLAITAERAGQTQLRWRAKRPLRFRLEPHHANGGGGIEPPTGVAPQRPSGMQLRSDQAIVATEALDPRIARPLRIERHPQ